MLAQGEVPIVFNCSAGKDRTGLAAALVLTALGVPYELVLEDYELSNGAFDARAEASRNGLRLSGDVIDALGGTHPDYLAAAWATIIDEHGGPMNYITESLGVSGAMVDAIRASLLE
jgi:protein-tyrosine phosphatase